MRTDGRAISGISLVRSPSKRAAHKPAGFPVAEDIGAAQLGELLAAVDAPAGDAAGDRVRQLDQRPGGSASARPSPA